MNIICLRYKFPKTRILPWYQGCERGTVSHPEQRTSVQVLQHARYLKVQTPVSLYVGKPFKFMIDLLCYWCNSYEKGEETWSTATTIIRNESDK